MNANFNKKHGNNADFSKFTATNSAERYEVTNIEPAEDNV